jgi:hypothetical protein
MSLADILLGNAGKEAADHESPLLTVELRQYAQSMGWPDRIALNLHIKQDDGVYTVSFPSDIEEDVNNLEYGTQDTPPIPVISTFLKTRINEQHFEAGLSKSLKNAGLI